MEGASMTPKSRTRVAVAAALAIVLAASAAHVEISKRDMQLLSKSQLKAIFFPETVEELLLHRGAAGTLGLADEPSAVADPQPAPDCRAGCA
jgi:hypothetical protein